MPPTFAQLGVPQQIVRALEAREIHEPFEIQAATIRDALAGRDVCGKAPTGSGKTLAFGIPLVANSTPGNSKHPTALVLAPTRELAEQIHGELSTFAGKVRSTVVYGGVGYGKQVAALRKGVEILVACPGRLEDLIERNDVSLSKVERVVIDEADRMADMGFLPAVRRLLSQTAKQRQTVLFSATLDGDVKKLTEEHQREPVRHEVGDDTPDVTSATHLFWKVHRGDRIELAAKLIERTWPAVVFVRTRHGADRLAKQLSKLDVDTAAIHGSRSQNQRNRALADFVSGKAQALIATDVAARGIHVDDVALVIHFDPPEDHKAYIHRSGRTARAGAEGVVVSMVGPDQAKDVRKIQQKVGLPAAITDVDLREVTGGGRRRSESGGRDERRPQRERRGPSERPERIADLETRRGGRRRSGRDDRTEHDPRGEGGDRSGRSAGGRSGGGRSGGNTSGRRKGGTGAGAQGAAKGKRSNAGRGRDDRGGSGRPAAKGGGSRSGRPSAKSGGPSRSGPSKGGNRGRGGKSSGGRRS